MSLKDLLYLTDRRRELEELLDNPEFAEFDPMAYHECWEEYDEITEILEDVALLYDK